MPEIIATVLAHTAETVLWRSRRAAMAGADWIELRLDQWPATQDLAPLIAEIRLPVLATCRTARDGGSFAGTLVERRELLQRAVEAGACGIDIEEWESWEPQLPAHTRLHIRSYHNLTTVPADLAAVRDRLLDRGANMAKLAVMAHDLAEAAPVFDLLAATDQEREPTTAFAMGRSVWPGRILSCLLGAPLIYASPGDDDAVGTGQPPIDLLARLYRLHGLSATTSIYGLLGKPALHSRGPWLHNRVLRQLGIDGIYLPFESSRAEAVLAMLPRRRLHGLSVTAPHKATAMRACHQLDEMAQATGVVNTLTFQAGGVVVGHNTDVAGVLAAFARAGLAKAEGTRQAAVLGSGGGARAGAIALARMGFEVTILARSLESIRAFARQQGFALASLRTEVLRKLAPQAVVHATPVGSAAASGTSGSAGSTGSSGSIGSTGIAGSGGSSPLASNEERLLPDWVPLPGTFVLDMVYHPRNTRLLRDVAAAGAIPVPGLDMFLTQAAEQILLFTGQRLAEADLRRFLTAV